MKRFILSAAALLAFAAFAGAQQGPQMPPKAPELQFTATEYVNPITSIKNQSRSGTCWAYSTISFIESEVIRINKLSEEKYPDFSEMFIVSKSYQDRADKYIRLDGHLTFAAGSEADDVLDVIRDYGLVPQSAMPGRQPLPNHGELDATAEAYVKAINSTKSRPISNLWKEGFKGIMDAYLGECPESFEVDGKTYTPAEYRDALNFNPDDYVTLTSFTHHPFYTKFAIEVCDNWRWDTAYNVPIDEFMEALDYALKHGYTAAWGSDISEKGFTRNGVALLLDADIKPTGGSDQERWVGKADEKPADAPAFKEKEATQESRQEGFDNKTITDDHGMHIYGIANDQYGNKYYMVKNSWGETGKYKGIWYASEAFVKNQSMDIVIHKSALTKDLKKKLGIK